MPKTTILAAAAALTLALTACGGVEASSTTSAPAGTNQGVGTSASAGAAPTADDSPAPESSDPVESGVAAFGKAYTWQDGLSVTVGKPSAYRPSESAAGTEQFDTFVVFEVRVVNKTTAPWDPAMFNVSVQSDNQEAEQVFDSGKLADQPMTKLLPGREAKFPVAFGVANPKDLVMELTPDFEHESVLFQQ